MMTAVTRSWLTASIALLAAGLFVASVVYLAETITGPRTVPADFTPDTTQPRSIP
jgi:hypothetical protein